MRRGKTATMAQSHEDTKDHKHYHLMAPQEAYDIVGGTEKSSEEWVSSQREKYGENKLKEAETRSLLAVIVSNFLNPVTAILGAVLVLACILEEWIEAVVVVLVILLNSTISIVQEYKSEQSMDAIRHLGGATNTTVIRDRRAQQIPLTDVVVGDIVEMKQGDVVPADVRLMELSRLEVDEAALTGESVPVVKTLAALPHPKDPDEDIAVGDRTNMAFRQTSVAQGSGRGVVVLVGEETEIGKIAERLAGGTSKKTALTVTMEKLMYFLVLVGLVFAIFIFWAFDWDVTDQALLYASATLVAILPEAAIVLITVTMAISVKRMAAANAIVRKMTALEQLGKVTDICSDKTGTLTEGKMRPAKLVLCQPNGDPLYTLTPQGPANSRKAEWSTPLTALEGEGPTTMGDALRALVLCSSTSMVQVGGEDSDDLEGHGSPTELAMMEMAWKITYGMKDVVPNIDAAKKGYKMRGTFDFDSMTKTMSTGWFHAESGTSLVAVKGAPESILPRCGNHPDASSDLMKIMDDLASDGLRMLAVAQRTDMDLSAEGADITSMERDQVEHNLRLLALCAVRDPPKQSSITAVTHCFSAGIVVRMLTGDHPATAGAIAKEIGIIPEGQAAKGTVTTGPKMDSMTDEELDELDDLPLIVARCSPESKVRMVEALHRRGKVVAMTGDGVNDSPSIKEADIGIAMGITGSDVTKGVADIVLADDNFATIVSAVQEGRRIFASISNFVMHLLSGNMAEAVVLMLSLGFVIDGQGNPIFVLSPIAILFINTATGSGPAIGIAMDDCAPDLMKRPPVSHSIFTKETVMDCFVYGWLMGGFSLAAFCLYIWVYEDGNMGTNCNTSEGTNCDDVLHARGCSFLALNTLLLLHAYNCRHQRMPFWKSPLGNKVLLGSLIIGTLVCVPLLYVPYLNTKVFKHRGGSWEWGMIAAMSVAFMMLCEFYKLVKRLTMPPLMNYVADSKVDVQVDSAASGMASSASEPEA